MSETFETNAQEALTMASGIKSHLSEVAHLGIEKEGLDKLEAEAIKALDMIADVQDVAKSYRHTIKNNFPMEQWERFGITDK